jgi:hypothetical protein
MLNIIIVDAQYIYYLIFFDFNPTFIFLLHVYTHPIVTTISSTTSRPTVAPKAGIIVLLLTVDMHVSEVVECVDDGKLVKDAVLNIFVVSFICDFGEDVDDGHTVTFTVVGTCTVVGI